MKEDGRMEVITSNRIFQTKYLSTDVVPVLRSQMKHYQIASILY
jgi:hypothetical protein